VRGRRRAEIAAVLDASALAAFLLRERGYEVVRPIVHRSAISTVNLGELLVVLGRRGEDAAAIMDALQAREIQVRPYTVGHALRAAEIDAQVNRKGALSLGDRACLALAQELGVPAFTADSVWEELQLPVEIRRIR